MGTNGDHPSDGTELNARELALHTYRHARNAAQSQGEMYMQMGALVGELSRTAQSLGEVALELRRFTRMSSTPPAVIMPAPTTNAARERQQSVHELDAMSAKLTSILDVDSGTETPGEDDTKVQKLKVVKGTAAVLLDMVEERKRKALSKIEQRAAWTWRFQVMGGIAAGLPILTGVGYVTILLFKLLLALATKP